MAVDDYFLKIDGIPGESLDEQYKGQIELLGFSWSEEQPGKPVGGGGGGTGRVTMSDLGVTMATNVASPRLLLAVASGEHLKSAVLTAVRAGKDRQEYLTFTLTEVLVSGYQIDASVDQGPVERVSFNFGQIKVEYVPQQPDGKAGTPVQVGWDVTRNQSL